MSGIASNPVAPPHYMRHHAPRPRSEAKRSRIIDAAMQHFAEHGYHAARVGDIAATLGIAKGSIFQHFGSKDGLFFEVYKRAVRSFSKYLDAPADVRAAGFFDVLYYWLVRTEHLLREDWIPYRISLLGNYGTDLVLKREINRFLTAEDPYGTVAFVRFGIERGELRKDMDVEMIVSILDSTSSAFRTLCSLRNSIPASSAGRERCRRERKPASGNSWRSCRVRWARLRPHRLRSPGTAKVRVRTGRQAQSGVARCAKSHANYN